MAKRLRRSTALSTSVFILTRTTQFSLRARGIVTITPKETVRVDFILNIFRRSPIPFNYSLVLLPSNLLVIFSLPLSSVLNYISTTTLVRCSSFFLDALALVFYSTN